VDQSTIQNKLKSLDVSSKVRFNVGMHGVEKDTELRYGAQSPTMQTLIRRRIRDNDGSIEIVKAEVKVEVKTSPMPRKNKPKTEPGREVAEDNQQKGDD
jgi:hypothetical protein